MSDFNYCRKCEKVTGITPDLHCATCGEAVCLVCGCTESRACINGAGAVCGWARPGICTHCISSVDAQGNPNGDQIAEMVAENRRVLAENIL